MEYRNPADNILPEGFDGVFRFTNWSEEDFKPKWNSIEYTYPAQRTTPMIISGESPENVQSIRKLFARQLAEREFYKTDKFKRMNGPDQGLKPALYTDSDLATGIQRCLEPLQVATPVAKMVKEVHEEVFRKDEDGKPRTRVLKSKEGSGSDESLVGNGTVIG